MTEQFELFCQDALELDSAISVNNNAEEKTQVQKMPYFTSGTNFTAQSQYDPVATNNIFLATNGPYTDHQMNTMGFWQRDDKSISSDSSAISNNYILNSNLISAEKNQTKYHNYGREMMNNPSIMLQCPNNTGNNNLYMFNLGLSQFNPYSSNQILPNMVRKNMFTRNIY